MGFGLHHHVHHHNENSAHGKFAKFIDEAVYFFGGFSIIVVIPQIITIWCYRKVDGVSPITWTGLLLSSIFWIFYGIVHKEKQLIIIYSFAVITNICVVLGLLLIH
jgi:uncharacterized protein with PQ loop repeat